MIEIIIGIIVFVILVVACIFVNDTKKKHGTCCGKNCPGCEVMEKQYGKQK